MKEITISKTGEISLLITPQELRIGNVLSYKGELVHVTMLSMDIDDEYQEIIGFCKLGESSNEISDWNMALAPDLNPVLITPEILVISGFNQSEKNYWVNGKYSLLQDMGGWHFDYVNADCRGERSIAYPDYLHQLQNVFFILTGNDFKLQP